MQTRVEIYRFKKAVPFASSSRNAAITCRHVSHTVGDIPLQEAVLLAEVIQKRGVDGAVLARKVALHRPM